jgi:Uma2 family endonuclease
MVELIRGKIYKMSPAPGRLHQEISGELFRQLANYLKGKKCKVFSAPFDVRLPLNRGRSDKEIFTVVQPDICVICDETKMDDRGCVGAPDWVIEVLLMNTSSKDLREKFDVYEEAGIKEYWVVHPQEQTLLVYILDDSGKYQGVRKPFIRTDRVASRVLPDLVIDLALVFPPI